MKWLRKNTRMNNDPNCPFYQIEVKDLNQKTIFPWEDVLLSEYLPDANSHKSSYRPIKPCPLCKKENNDLETDRISSSPKPPLLTDYLFWVHFKSPSWTWRKLCGREGYLSICSKHKIQVDFLCTVIN